MFRKRLKKEFPAGTFIPTPARVMAILQLSIALMVLLWQLSQPYMGDLFTIRSKMAVYEYVLGNPAGNELQQRQAHRFNQLPEAQQTAVKEGYQQWTAKLQEPFWHKLKRAFENVLFNMPLFEKLWLVLSLVIPILILLKVEGSVPAAWLIPLVVFAYAVDNRWSGEPHRLSKELQLFPSEEYLLKTYVDENVDPNPFNQKESLEAGWKAYLVQEWAHETPSSDEKAFEQQVETGEYAFTVGRALAIEDEKPQKRHTYEATSMLTVYLLWNIAFAYVVTKYSIK